MRAFGYIRAPYIICSVIFLSELSSFFTYFNILLRKFYRIILYLISHNIFLRNFVRIKYCAKKGTSF